MAAACPNRTRKKRLGPGGGSVSCSGRLVVRLLVPVEIPLKGKGNGPPPTFEEAIPVRYQRHGIRIRPPTLVAAYYATQGAKMDLACDSCDWSYNRVLEALRRQSRELERRRRRPRRPRRKR